MVENHFFKKDEGSNDKMEIFNERTKTTIELAKIVENEIKRILHDEDIHTTGKGLNDFVTVQM